MRPIATRTVLSSLRHVLNESLLRVKFVKILLSAFSAIALAVVAAVAQPTTNSPLYLLTYDHGGVILWGTDHFAERLRNAIAWLDRYPDFKIGLENEAYAYDYMAEHDPALLDELRRYLSKYKGRFGIGTCTYGQPLSTFINEESNIRQIVYALKTDQRLLGCRPTIYLMSEHAMHGQMPQILNSLGFEGAILRTHFMMYGFNPTFDLPIGWWIGLDGSRIPAIPTYPGEGAAFGRTTVDNWFLTRFPGPEATFSPEDYCKQFSQIRPLLASRADDSGLRQEELVRRYAGNTNYQWVLLDDLPSVFHKPAAEMKTVPNDFKVRMPWGYCGNEIWNRNREAEVQVLTAERLAALGQWLGLPTFEPELDRAWRNLLVGQHHDVQICGLLPEARKFLTASITGSTNVLYSALERIGAQMKSEGIAQVTVFNPLSWPRQEWVQTEVSVSEVQTRALEVRHGKRAMLSTLLHVDRSSSGNIRSARLAFLAELPPLAVCSYSVVPAAEPGPVSEVSRARTSAGPAFTAHLEDGDKVVVDEQNLRITTPFYKIQLAPSGGIASLKDRRNSRDWLKSSSRNSILAGRINAQDCESTGKWTLHAAGDPGQWAVAREYGFIGVIPYELELVFWSDKPRVDCLVKCHFEGEKIGLLSDDLRDSRSPFAHEYKLRFKLFPMLGPEATGIRDVPFAVSETTNRYVDGLYWTAMADSSGGLAVFNRGTMGAVREVDSAFSIPLAYAMHYVWGTRMLSGDFSYEFAFCPFNGDWRRADLSRQALAYNFPVVFTTRQTANGKLGDTFSPLQLGSDRVLLSSLYSEGGKLFARLFESSGEEGKSAIESPGRSLRFREVDGLGNLREQITNAAQFLPWQVRTFQIEYAR